VDACVARMKYWHVDGRVAYPLLFRNWGRGAGASLTHAHTQLIALPRVPTTVISEMGNMSGHYLDAGVCLMCQMAKTDDVGGRTVYDAGTVLVQSPWPALTPYRLRIVPKECARTFEDARTDVIDGLAQALSVTARLLRAHLGDPAFNLIARVSPYSLTDVVSLPFHWHIEVIPRLFGQAGYEIGSGAYINSTDPDDVARALRATLDGLESGV